MPYPDDFNDFAHGLDSAGNRSVTSPMQRKTQTRTSELTRRGVLSVAVATAAAAPAIAAEGNPACRIGPAPHTKGPRVFLDYDQIELDAAYEQRAYAPLGDQITARFITDSEETRRRLGNPQRVAYGPGEIEKLDIFSTSRANAPPWCLCMAAHGCVIRPATSITSRRISSKR